MPAGIRVRLFGLVLVSALAAACGSKSTQPTPTPCAYSVSGASFGFTAAGGTATVTVSTGATCAWTARADAGWITISSGASGTGPGTVAFSVATHSGGSPRSGGLTIADHAISVNQDAPVACTLDITPSTAVHTKDAGTGSFSVIAPAGCPWRAASAVAWIAPVSASGEGSGSATVTYSVSRNTETAARSGGITVVDRVFLVTQSGDSGACQYGVSPVDFSPCMRATQMTAAVTTQPGCSWTASATDAWITIAGGQSGTGSGTVVFSVTDNWTAPRSGQVLVRWPTPTAGQNIRIAQAGCRYSVSPATISVAAAGGSNTVSVYQQSDPYTCGGALQDACTWTAESTVPWITVTSSMPRAGDNPFSFAVAPNTGPARTGTILVRDQVVRINQGGI